jgi:hypothetical protein
MALIACEECKREISSRAASCPHCGCPIAPVERVDVVPARASAPPPDRIPEVKVRVDMPPGLGTATVSAIKSAASSKAWGRLYLTLRAIALVWLVGFAIAAVVVYNEQQTAARARLRDLLPESGLVQLTWADSAFDFIDSVPQKEARQKLQSGSYRLATVDEIERQTKLRQNAVDTDPLLGGGATVCMGLAPLAVLEALRRWLGWLKAPSRSR